MISKKSFKLLCVGNSFSDNALKYAYQILNSFGVQNIVVANLYIGGCTLETHKKNIIEGLPAYEYKKNSTGVFDIRYNTTLDYGLMDEEWDFITMQQSSGSSGMIETYDVSFINKYLYTNAKSKNVKIGWNMTWAYPKDSKHDEFVKYHNNQDEMYQQIVKCVEKVIKPDKNFAFLAPLGTAIQNARTSYIGDTLTPDGFHLESLGEFIAGTMLIEAITKWNLDDMNLNLIPQQFISYIDIVKESVNNALKKPFNVTKSKIVKEKIENECSVEVIKDIEYGFENYKLDLYLPTCELNETLIQFHGGGLVSGSKDDDGLIDLAINLSKNGKAIIVVDYPLLNDHSIKQIIEASKQSIEFVKEYFKKNSIKSKLVFSGQSAGAYIGMMLAFKENVDLDGWIIDAGQPTTHFNVLERDGLDPRLIRVDENSALYYIDEKTKISNMLLISYTRDLEGRCSQNRVLYDTLKCFNKDAKVTLKIYEGNHCDLTSIKYRNKYAYTNIVNIFLKEI